MRPRTSDCCYVYESKRMVVRALAIGVAAGLCHRKDSMVMIERSSVPKDLYTSAVVEDVSTTDEGARHLVTTFGPVVMKAVGMSSGSDLLTGRMASGAKVARTALSSTLVRNVGTCRSDAKEEPQVEAPLAGEYRCGAQGRSDPY